MATSAVRTPSARRPSDAHSALSSNNTSLSRGATARSAVSPKVSALSRRGSVASKQSSIASNAEAESASSAGLAAALKKETEEKEELLVRVQNKDQSISELSSENSKLSTALSAAEARLTELYADQARVEEETVTRLELVDRLRAQLQESEREKRDLFRRYNEQTATFDAERQSYYDNEQHLKSRIQSLVQARKTMELSLSHKASVQTFSDLKSTDISKETIPEENGAEPESGELSNGQTTASQMSKSDAEDPVEQSEPAEMTSLRLELSTLSTSYASLQNTVQHLSSQLLDLKRVNTQLQDENESYNILLREKTLNGQFNIMKSVSATDIEEGSAEEETYDEDDDMDYGLGEQDSLGSRDRTPLEPVDELVEEGESQLYGELEQETLVQDDSGSISSGGAREHGRRFGRGGKRTTKSRSPPPKGESLAGLPVAGPGLDLAAELGRAENSSPFSGTGDIVTGRDRSASNAKTKKSKRQSIDRKAMDAKLDSNTPDVDSLRNEVKSLKDANKALSLYASKIIDRICAQEGFEHVLCADYDKPLPSPTKTPAPKKLEADESQKTKQRPQSAIFGLGFSSDPPPASPMKQTMSENSGKLAVPEERTATARAQRRSLSFDWRGFNVFGGGEKKPETNPNLRPLSLKPGQSSVVGRKLDLPEDEEDKKERERLHATMKLMGIDKPKSPIPPSPGVGSPGSFASSQMNTPNMQSDTSSPRPSQSRFSFFRSRSNTTDASPNSSKPNLTAEALERREAETTLAALDEREKQLSVEIAKGANGGFTELPARRQRGEGRSRKSGKSRESGSGSTVWSAGMSTHIEESGDEGAKP